MEHPNISCRVAEGRERDVFAQYLLPVAESLSRKSGENALILGAVWDTAACGAAAVRLTTDARGAAQAKLLSLYVDPQVRRRGVGLKLLQFAIERSAQAGAARFVAHYAAEGNDMDALDALFRKAGMNPRFRLPVYIIQSADLRDSATLHAAFSHKYRRPDHIVPFSALTAEQTERLCRRPDLPDFLNPAGRPGLNPDLSLAYLKDGEPEGIWLCASTALRHFSVLGVWRSKAAPPFCFHEMILAHFSLCFYYGGGDFQYYVSPAVEFADRLIKTYSQGKYRRLEERSASMRLDGQAEPDDKENAETYEPDDEEAETVD